MARRHLRRLTPVDPNAKARASGPWITRCGTALTRQGVLLLVANQTRTQATPLANRRVVAVER